MSAAIEVYLIVGASIAFTSVMYEDSLYTRDQTIFMNAATALLVLIAWPIFVIGCINERPGK